MPSDDPRPRPAAASSSPPEAEPEQSRPADTPTADEKQSREPSSAPTDEPRDHDADGDADGDASSSEESGEASESASPAPASDAPPLPNEAPPLPSGPPPATEDDGWDFQWDATSQAYFFYNRFTGATQWENPRVASAASTSTTTTTTAAAAPGTDAATSAPLPSGPPPLPSNDRPAAGGYNPAIHGDYDPTAWYAQADKPDEGDEAAQQAAALAEQGYGAVAQFNRFTGQFQAPGDDPGRHTDEAKSRRQMNAFFDVDAAANSHDGRSLKAERSGKKPSKQELKQFKEKRRARKEEKRRAWLRD
ncbi:WW domain-containing protein [Colletotrichum karsti]|uniref:WW domain-containing protein n=1 Tax=Colletotrichum karsti TaxID=1095194 RepID=A0A9P6HWA8_9PEZI|nr:WW domain-containing protein [Colletotrichum karsti]KAF9872648.1 WW domain-containing protein [Colletotrichum karsti]